MTGKKYEFTDEEINYIVSNWGKESPHSMKKKIGCTWYAVCKVAEEHGLEIPTSNVWTEEEISTLRELSDKFHYSEIATMMGKTENSIYLKARRLGITLIQDRRKWTKEEEKLFCDLWGYKSIDYIAKKLKRTVFSLKVKAVRMGLGPMIKNNCDILTVSDISDLLGVTRDRIVITWVKCGINLKQIKLTKDMSYYIVSFNDLLKFLKENQNEWDSRKLEKYIFGEEEDWLLEKRKRDYKENPLWYRKWTADEVKDVVFLFRSGKNYLEISKEVNRSEWSVANLLRNMGYSYRLPKYWSGNELKYLKENYENMTYSEIAEQLDRTEKAVSVKASELGYQKKIIRSNNKK